MPRRWNPNSIFLDAWHILISTWYVPVQLSIQPSGPLAGYNEIQKPRRKCVVIAHERLAELCGFDSIETFRKVYQEIISEALANGSNRQAEWTESIAVGSKGFIEEISTEFGILAKGRKFLVAAEGFQLREELGNYLVNFAGQTDAPEGQNQFLRDDIV